MEESFQGYLAITGAGNTRTMRWSYAWSTSSTEGSG